MQVKGANFLLTFKCPSQCKHCCYKAGPERNGAMDLEDAERWLSELKETQPFQSLTVHGGEPFFYFEILKRIMQKAKDLEVSRRWVITNGYWAETEVIAKEKLSELKDSGLTCITFSVDGFHQEYISLEKVKNGLEAAASLNFEKVSVDSYFVVNPESENFYDVLTRKAIDDLEELKGIEINRYQVDFEGRGAALVRYVEVKNKVPSGRCQLPYWLEGTLESPKGIEIDREGNVTLCPGICIGNVRNQSLTRILENYDYHDNPIIRIIAEEGPVGLLRLVIEKGLKIDQRFVNECHLCYEMRKYLYHFYPQHLAPSGCY